MRAARLITLLLLLQSRGRMSGPALADALEVSVRTVYRDIEALSGGGVPIYAERGTSGGFSLLEGYRLQLETLTAAEAAALPLLMLPDVAVALGVEDARAAAALKLGRALPAAHRELADATAALLHVDLAADADGLRARPWLQALTSAARSTRTVEVETSAGTLALDPLGLVYARGWVAVGMVEAGPEVRAVPLSDIRAVTSTPRRFTRPPDFDLRTWWRDR